MRCRSHRKDSYPLYKNRFSIPLHFIRIDSPHCSVFRFLSLAFDGVFTLQIQSLPSRLLLSALRSLSTELSCSLGHSIESSVQKMVETLLTLALEGLKSVKSNEGEILTKPFLDVYNFGSTMALVKSNIGGNISRLEFKYSSNPQEFRHLYSMVRADVEAAKGPSGCSGGLLWLTRAMDFLVELFRNLLEHPNWTMPQVCTDSYNKTLKKWHGWLARSGFTVIFYPVEIDLQCSN